MATVRTYSSTIDSARSLYNNAPANLNEKINALKKNIESLNNPSAISFHEIKGTLKKFNQQMLTYYLTELPTVLAAREGAAKTSDAINRHLDYLYELPSLSDKSIKHLERLGCKAMLAEMKAKQKGLGQGQVELEMYVLKLDQTVEKIDDLQKQFMEVLNDTLKKEGDEEGTTSYFDTFWSYVSYAHLNKDLKTKRI
jgi:hypothetical protein